MMIDIDPLLPLLDAAQQAKHAIRLSLQEWDQMTEEEKNAQALGIKVRDAVLQQNYSQACRKVADALHDAVVSYGN